MEHTTIVERFAIVLAAGFAVTAGTPVFTILPCALFEASFDCGLTLLAFNLLLNLIEVGHDVIVALVEFGGAGFIGIFGDSIQGFAGLSYKAAALFLQLGESCH
ncbi:hypothetical protein D3C87_1489030 [compost metagenome]